MRPIKFRGYHNDYKHMFYFGLGENYLSFVDEENSFYSGIEITNLEVMQFTGLLDKHSKEIYEGDICRFGNDMVVIQWYQPQASFEYKYIGGDEYSLDQLDTGHSFEIIGNIHEHKHLIEEGE